MRLIRWALLVAALTLGCSSESTPAKTETDPSSAVTEQGKLRGVSSGNTLAFKGIRYAASPVGALRWRAPEPAPSFDEERVADQVGASCVQLQGGSGDVIGDEDCLTLNVWRPASRSASPRTVLVYLHGGANIFGSASEVYDQATGKLSFDGEHLSDRGDAVVVTLNYRLGPFGFLAHPAFAKENPEGSSGNYGLLDQIAALEWIRKNVHAFGGDPDRVMLFGQSAGAVNTCALMTSPRAKGLFHRALMESGFCLVAPPAQIQKTVQNVEQALGCAGAGDVAACLRQKSATELALTPGASTAHPSSSGFGGSLGDYNPVVDGYVLPVDPAMSLEAGSHNHMPVVMGTTHDEYYGITFIMYPAPIDTDADYLAAATALFGADVAAWVVTQYPSAEFPTPRHALGEYLSDLLQHCPVRRQLRSLAAASKEPLWRYDFDFAYRDGPSAKRGASHGTDVGFLWPSNVELSDAQYTKLSDAMTGYWSRFAESGDPNGANAAPWPAYSAATDPYIVLGDPMGQGAGLHSARCDVIDAALE